MKVSSRQFPSWCCQRCGDQIGYLGRFVEFLYSPLLWIVKGAFHDCPALFAPPTKKIAERESYERSDDFPVFSSADAAIDEKGGNARTNQNENGNTRNA